jgi:hypothetical protein
MIPQGSPVSPVLLFIHNGAATRSLGSVSLQETRSMSDDIAGGQTFSALSE